MKLHYVKQSLFSVAFLSSLISFAQTPQQIENAMAFAKLYGYVKYFHPSDEASSIDWNRFAIYGSQKVSESKNEKELQANLQDIFKPIAPTLQIFSENQKSVLNKEELMATGSDYKTIAWQHSGVGLGGQGNTYQSLRTNRPVITTGSFAGFAPVNSWLDATSLQGKEFVFRGKMRMANGEGQGQLWVRVDKTDKTRGFFDNMQDRPVKKKDWSSYEIRGKIDNGAAKLFFGVMLVGEGEVEFDDLSLQVKEGEEWKELYLETFTNSEENTVPKGLALSNTVQASYAIAVKKRAESNESFVAIKSKELTPEVRPHERLFNAYPQVGEYIEKRIGGGLKVLLPLALYGSATQTFPVGDTGSLQKLKQGLASVVAADVSGDQLYTRLGDLAITWNIFQHFYPYFDVVKVDWEAALKEAITQAYTDKTAAGFQKILQRLTAKLKDGHIRVNWFASKSVYLPLIGWEWIEDELVITHVGDSSLSIKRGDIVKKIDNQPAKDFFAAIYPTISAGTKGWLDYRAQTESLTGEKGSVINLTIVRSNNQTEDVSLARTANLSQYYAALPKKDSIKMLPNDIAYINLDNATMEAINNALPQLKKSRVIICDLRGYPRNNHGFLHYLMKQKDTSARWMQVPQTIYPDRENGVNWQYHGWGMKPSKPHLDAKVIFLIDGQAISYAESYMSFVEHYKLATIIGQPTAGANGNINPFALPGGYSISWTGMRVVKHDGSTHHTVGIQPHIRVHKTIKGVREDRDEYLEKALEVAGKPL